MRIFRSLLGFVLLTALMVTTLALPAAAADSDYTFYGTAGETEYFVITSDETDLITEVAIESGSVPGMELNVAGDVTLGLAGVPSTDGEFTLSIAYTTRDHGNIRISVTVYINPSSTVSGTPTVTKNPTGEKVVEGDSATFIARADNVKQYIWHIAIGEASLTSDELEAYVGKGLTVTGHNADTLVLSNIPLTLNDAYIWCQFVGTEDSVDSTAAVLTVTAAKDATPVVTKSPTDETVDEGGDAIFIAKAKYAQEYTWYFVDPWGDTVPCADGEKIYPGLQISGETTERIVLENIPAALDGYRIYCNFTAGQVVSSEMAYIYVNPDPTATTEATQAPTETTEATDEPTETTEAPTEAPTEKPAEAPKETAPGKEEKEEKEEKGGSNTLIIVAMICFAAVAIAGIAAYVILQLRRPEDY